MPKIVSNTVSVYAFRVEGDRPWYLLLRRAQGRKLAGAWQVVHGHIEDEETAVDAALRELREETELVPQALWAVDHVERMYDPRKDHIRLVPCFAALVAGDAHTGVEHDAKRWLTEREAMSLFTFENQRAALAVLHRDIAQVVATGGEPSAYLRVSSTRG